MNYSTTMVDLLNNTKKALLTETLPSGTLSSIGQRVKLGTTRNPIKYPFLTVIPIEERPNGIWNGLLDNIRKIRIEVYSNKVNSKSAMRASMGIMEKVKDIFLVGADNWEIPDKKGNSTVYDTQILEIEPGSNPIPWRNGFISSASLEMDCYSKDPLFENIYSESYSTIVETDSKSLIDTISSIYKGYKTGSESLLTSIEAFKDFTLPPQINYPVLFIGIEEETREHKFAGRDSIFRLINIYLLHKMTDKEESLKRNLIMVNFCRQILFANNTFKGRAAHYEYRGIAYGSLEAETGLLYGSSLRFMIESYENLAKA